jgi:hypothetical protein
MLTNSKSYDRYVAWCQILGIRPLGYASWVQHATEILMSLTETGDAKYAQDVAGFWLERQPGREFSAVESR